MQPSDFKYAPIEYAFMYEEQPDEQAWQSILQFAREWNTTHKNQFIQQENNELSIILPDGILDAEMPPLDEALTSLKEKGIEYEKAFIDERRSGDFDKAPWVEIIGDEYPPSTYENYRQVFEQPRDCERCGAPQETGALTGVPLIVDESVLDKGIAGLPQFDPPGLDLINLPNGAFLISARVADLMKANNITGYELLNVISKETGQPSQRLFMLKLNKAILDACDVHTPRDPGAICPACGSLYTGVLGFFYVRAEWLDGDELFSRNPSHLSDICISNRLYNLLKEMGCKRLLASNGLFNCDHTK